MLADLARQLPDDAETLLAVVAKMDMSAPRTRIVVCRPGRAAQMNAAAAVAEGDFLWFLHADTRMPPDAVAALLRSLAAAPDALHYFGLRFHDGPAALRLNAVGVGLRSRLLGMPFGDQGLCLRRSTFAALGGFDEAAVYGEDHLFVWTARRAGVRLRRVPATLSTSGRKYARGGWARTTARHLRLTLLQALPQAARLLLPRRVRRA